MGQGLWHDRKRGARYVPVLFKCVMLSLDWSFMSWQYLRSYQDSYQLVTACTHGAFMVPPYLEIRSPAPWPDIPLNIIPTLSQPASYPNNAERLARKWQVQIYRSLVWSSTHSAIQSGHWNYIQMTKKSIAYQQQIEIDRDSNFWTSAKEACALPIRCLQSSQFTVSVIISAWFPRVLCLRPLSFLI